MALLQNCNLHHYRVILNKLVSMLLTRCTLMLYTNVSVQTVCTIYLNCHFLFIYACKYNVYEHVCVCVCACVCVRVFVCIFFQTYHIIGCVIGGNKEFYLILY